MNTNSSSVIPFVCCKSLNDAIERQDVDAVKLAVLYGRYTPVHLHGALRKAVISHIWSSNLNTMVDLLLHHGASPFFDPFQGHGGPCTFVVALNNSNQDLIRKFTFHALQQSDGKDLFGVVRYLYEAKRYHDIDTIYEILTQVGDLCSQSVKDMIHDIRSTTSNSLPLHFALLDIS